MTPGSSGLRSAPARATWDLSPAEERFQGEWHAYTIEYDRLDYALTFEGRDFRAVAYCDGELTDERYEGYIVLRSDIEPAPAGQAQPTPLR